MKAGGVFVVDGATLTEVEFIKTGVGTHGLYPSRDGARPGVAVIDFATRKIVATWPIPGGGSPDMGNVSVDGTVLWLSGRYDNVVYAIDTATGQVQSIPVGKEPHGSDGLASARALLSRPHGQHALSIGIRRNRSRSE
jgi:DNA-binding beta-propeller fold protein YncE